MLAFLKVNYIYTKLLSDINIYEVEHPATLYGSEFVIEDNAFRFVELCVLSPCIAETFIHGP